MKTATKERPILFSGEMVKAILDGRKTVTRRVVKDVPTFLHLGRPIMDWPLSRVYQDGDGEWMCDVQSDVDDAYTVELRCPYGQPGDRLWVRETWRYYWDDTLWCCINYRADDARIKPDVPDHNTGHMMAESCDQSLDDKEPWKPSIHMPRWASRITLEVVSVRVEQLQDITDDECVAEGFDGSHWWAGAARCDENADLVVNQFQETWDQLNASRGCSWESNPWVWRVEFSQLKGD